LIEEDFLIIKCKSARAKFFPELFQNGKKINKSRLKKNGLKDLILNI